MEPEKAPEELKKLEMKFRRLEKQKSRKVAAETLKKKCIIDHLKREQQFSLETEKRVCQDWEQMCADMKCEDLLEEMLQIKQNIQLIWDRKNFYIERLFGDRDEMEDIYSRHLQRLKRLVDCYLEIHQYFVTNLSKQYQADYKLQLTKFRHDIDLKDSQASECLQQMEGALISLDEAMKQGLIDDRVAFLKTTDENVNELIEKRCRMHDRKLHQTKLVHNEIMSVLNDYFTMIMDPEKGIAHHNLNDKHKRSQMIIQSNRAKIRELNLRINHLHKKITTVEIAGARKVIAKRLIKRNMLEEIDTLKRKIFHLDVHHMNRMKKMSYEAFNTEKYLSNLLERGNSILSLAQTCSKYECEDDLKYFKDRIAQGNTADSSPEYAFFFDKINRGKAINLLLREERDKLLQMNCDLQRQFQDYCQLNSPEANIARLQPTVRSVELGDRFK
ncbi:uncharacterized protein LOC135708009 [Ochlerotatus camptorhynchus]|uniref:uncharacterized protein LOC135708009 n=1 Tax=Ochlerotatus camptorhynchus TaxID=644619 RepID=UPI0031D43684